MRADELFKEAELQGYVEPSRRIGPPSPEEADQMSNWDIDICMARQGSEGWSSFADKAVATVRRLEDLRRWRPMTEHPVDDRHVLCAQMLPDEEPALPTTALWDGEWLTSDDDFEDPIEESKLAAASIFWTYIPGQEPKEEV